MIICKAPFRLSLFGGSSDYPDFIAKNGYGVVINCAIDKYCYIAINKLPPFHKYKSRIRYDKTEKIFESNKYICHPIIRNCLSFAGLEDEPLEITHLSDVPGGSGLGTSSTMIVAMLEALKQYKHDRGYLEDYQHLREAAYVEQRLMKQNVGFQDYLAAIYGGCNYFKIVNPTIGVELEEVKIIGGRFRQIIEEKGLLFYTGINRTSSEIVNKYINESIVEEYQLGIRNIAEQAISEINDKCRYWVLCELLNASMDLKRSMSPDITPPEVAEKMAVLTDSGADAIRLLGGGGGGSVFLLCDSDRHYNIIEQAEKANMVHIPFVIANKGVERIL